MRSESRDAVLARTLPGRVRARQLGTLGGRPKVLNAEQVLIAMQLYDDRTKTVAEICTILGISKPTFYAYIRERHKKS